MKTLVTGCSGLVGTELAHRLRGNGHEVVPLVRTEGSTGIRWNPSEGKIDAAALEGFDAVVHLAGENIADGRWTSAKKERILNSRVGSTKLLADTLARLNRQPRVLVSASAIGYYGNRGDLECDESTTPGDDFLADVCRRWEEASSSASEAGMRVVNARIGVVLTPRGSILKKILFPFRMGVGGVVGNGSQYMSWITLDDLVSVLVELVESDQYRGPVNTVSPQPVTNRVFTKALGRALRRPTIFPMPAFAARLAFGEMADALLLSSTRVVPGRLSEHGFTFKHPDIDTAFSKILS